MDLPTIIALILSSLSALTAAYVTLAKLPSEKKRTAAEVFEMAQKAAIELVKEYREELQIQGERHDKEIAALQQTIAKLQRRLSKSYDEIGELRERLDNAYIEIQELRSSNTRLMKENERLRLLVEPK